MHIARNIIVAVVILWGMLAVGVRLAAPALEKRADAFAEVLSQRLGTPVEFADFSVRWFGPGPVATFSDVTIGERHEQLRASRLVLQIGFAELLVGDLLDALYVTVDGMQLTLVREAGGQLRIEGVGPVDRFGDRASRSSTGPLAAIPGRLQLANTRVVWIDRQEGRAPLTVDDVNVVFERDGEAISAWAKLTTAAGDAELGLRLRGLLTSTDWSGESYLRVDGADLPNILGGLLPRRYGIASANADLEAWMTWEAATPVSAQGRFELRDIVLDPPGEEQEAVGLDGLAADFQFHSDPQRRQLTLQGLQVAFPDRSWPENRLALAWPAPGTSGVPLSIAIDYANIADVAALLQLRPPDPAWQAPLRALQPGGTLNNLHADLYLDDDSPRWNLTTEFAGVRNQPTDDIPGTQDLSGRITGQQDNLRVTVDSPGSTVTFATLFREPISFTRLRGSLELKRDRTGWSLHSPGFDANTAHLSTRSRVRLEQHADKPLFLDIQTAISDADLAHAKRYYPVGGMNPQLVAWLDRSIQGGRLTDGNVLVYGPASDYAFEKTRSGMFEALLDIDGVTLDYREGWPQIDDLAARVRFHGNKLDISATAARIYDSETSRLEAHIDSIKPAGSLHIDGQLSGPLEDVRQALQADALAPRFGAFAEPLVTDGNSELNLEFAIPLGRGGQSTLDGRLVFSGNRLALPEWDLELSDVEGILDFDLSGLYGRGLQARTLGKAVYVDVETEPSGDTQVNANGTFPVDALQRQWPFFPADVAQGSAPFTVGITIPPSSRQGAASTLQVDSELEGIVIALPPPFGKPAAESAPFNFLLPLSKDGRATIAYADKAAAKFSRDGRSVDVWLGPGNASPRSEVGIRIGGRLDRIDLLEWVERLSLLAHTDAGDIPPLSIDLDISNLQLPHSAIEELRVNAEHEQSRWNVRVDSDAIAGHAKVPADLGRRPISVHLDRLHLDLPLPETAAPSPPLPDSVGPDPARVPALTMSIDSVRLNNADLGRARLTSNRVARGLMLDSLYLTGGQLEIAAAGAWTQTARQPVTRIEGTVRADDAGRLLSDLGYEQQAEDAGGAVTFGLTWPGGPAQFHRATVRGGIGLAFNEGRIIELDPGATRVIGLLNLNALTRRLRLDFSDVYKKGYSFDNIVGDIAFENGVASTDNIVLNGPTGRITLDGSVDLVAETVDQHVSVTPNFDVTLPIAGTLTGGPIAGVAVLLAQEVLTKDIDAINRFEYRIHGDWIQPDVEQLDTGGTLSRLIRPLASRPKDDPPVTERREATASEAPDTGAEGSVSDDSAAPSDAASTPAATAPAAEPGSPSAEPELKSGLSRVLRFLRGGEPTAAGGSE